MAPTKLRVLSLLPSATEMVCALDQMHVLVGRSHDCDFPSQVKKLPVVTSPHVSSELSSADIHKSVQTQLHSGASTVQLKESVLRDLHPDLILTQSDCSVRAVDEKQKILSLQAKTLQDVWDSFLEVAQALGVPEMGRDKLSVYHNKIKKIQSRVAVQTHKPRVAMLEWIDPLMAAGNWVPELVQLAGGDNVFGQAGQHSSWMDYEALRSSDPEIICFLPCGFSIQKTRDELEVFASRPGWFDLQAVKNNRVYLLDGHHYFNRPGPRLVDSLEILAEIFHPDEFDFGHRNDGWEYWGFDRF